MKAKPKAMKLHRRNAAEIPSDELLPLAPLPPPEFSGPMTMLAPRRPRGVVRRKAAALAEAVRPQAATIDKAHLMSVGANAAGGLAAALAAHEFADNLGAMPMAVTTSIVGGVGALLLGGNWQRAAQGMLGAGVGQIGVAYLAERGLKKGAAKPAAPTAPAAPPEKRNAYLPGGDEAALVRALERAERRVAALLDEERNAGPYIDADAFEIYPMATA
jgi:hypothetical protein